MKLELYAKINGRELGAVLLGWFFLNFRWMDYLIRFQGSYALISVLLSVGIIFWFKKIKGDYLPLFLLDKNYWPSFVFWTGVALLLIPMGLMVGLVTFSLNWYRIFVIPAIFVGMLLTVSLVEELVFRRVALIFMERRWGVSAALIGSSVLFGLSHVVRGTFPNWSYVLLATLAGLIYGIVFCRYGLSYAIILHSVVDTFKFAFLER